MNRRTVARREGFAGDLWLCAQPVYEKILSHPFVRGLADGSLPRERFRYYILQDSLYLREYARALNLLGVRAPDEGTFKLLDEHAAGTLAVERSLHEGLFEELGIAQEVAMATEPSPTTLAYSSFLLRMVTLGEFHEALAAVLPCYWVYWEVSSTLRERGSTDFVYQGWIDAYADEDFGALVAAMLDLTDRACENLNESQRRRPRAAFVTSSRYEWMFWDAAWRLEEWSVR